MIVLLDPVHSEKLRSGGAWGGGIGWDLRQHHGLSRDGLPGDGRRQGCSLFDLVRFANGSVPLNRSVVLDAQIERGEQGIAHSGRVRPARFDVMEAGFPVPHRPTQALLIHHRAYLSIEIHARVGIGFFVTAKFADVPGRP